MTTVGYGDISPITYQEQIYSIFAMIFACGVFAYTVGSIGNLIASSNYNEQMQQERFKTVNKFMKRKEIPRDLQFKIKRYLEFIFELQEAD